MALLYNVKITLLSVHVIDRHMVNGFVIRVRVL